MSTRDYTDSESDADQDILNLASSQPQPPSAASTPPRDMSPASSPTKAGPSDQPMRITLRPGLSHLAADSSPSTSTSAADASGSGSASPPRFKIKLGMKHSLSASAVYSSSDEDQPSKEPPAKKQRTKKAKAPKEPSPGPQRPAHRKTYDWLAPSAVGSSHHGPEGRSERALSALLATAQTAPPVSAAQSPALDSDRDDASARGSVPPEGGKKKSRRKGEAGPGKNWRKGMKKGDPMPWKEGSSFMGDKARSSPLATPQRASVSREVSPDLDAMLLATVAKERVGKEREPSPPFELADAAKLGFPVFANPIKAPKINLSNFPKVTQFFAPFDQKPFRNEKVREWAVAEKSIQTVGGGALKFKTWTRGPQSELGVVLQAQREADLAAKAAKRESKMNKDSEPPAERPTFMHSLSSDSVPRAVSVDGDNESEVGDGDESVILSARESPAPSPSRRRKAPAKPRKSKLAQEIKLTEPEGSDSPSDAPVPKVEVEAEA